MDLSINIFDSVSISESISPIVSSLETGGVVTMITPIELTTGVLSSWVEHDVSSHIPSGSTGVIIHIVNESSNNSYNIGFRKNGSTDNRINSLYASSHFWTSIGIDSNRIFEFYRSDSTVHFYLCGYFNNNAVFFDNAIDKTPGTSTSWEDVDISTNTGGDTAIGAIFEVIGGAGVSYGARKNGSTDTVLGDCDAHSSITIGVDGSEICELYKGSSTITFYLVGYIKAGAVFHTNAVNRSISTTSSYIDITLESDAHAGLFDIISGSYSQTFAIRKKGDYEDIYKRASGEQHSFAIIQTNSDRKIEAKISNVAVDFYEVGYFLSNPNIDISDSLTITENIAIEIISDLFISINDSLTITENVSLLIEEANAISINVSDTITANEYITIGLADIKIQVDTGGTVTPLFDAISITENISFNITADIGISVYDTISITESEGQEYVLEIDINDAIAIIDNGRLLPSELKVWINEIDKTRYISQSGFQIDNILTSQVDKCKFQIQKVANSTILDYQPTIGQDVQITYQFEKIFGGIITRINKFLDTTGILIYDCECEDYTKILDRKLVAKSYENQTVNQIIADINATYLTDFTIYNVDCSVVIDYIAFNYITVSKALAKLADLVHFDWYVDYNRDIHFFSKTSINAPFDILDTDGSYNINTLKIKQDNSQIRNSIYVRGGEYLADTFTTEIQTDGVRNIYDIPYKYQALSCTLTGQPQSVGLDYIDNANDYDLLWNFQEKLLKWKEADKPALGATLRIGGRPYLPVRLKTKNIISINTMSVLEGGDGEYEFIIIDDSIKSKEGALERANAELNNYKNTLIEGNFQTYKDGLRAGQKIRINSPLYDINEDYLINQVSIGMWTPTKLIYNVKIVSTKTYGLIEFLQDLLLRDNNKILDIGENIVIIDLIADTSYETMSIADTMTVAFNHPQYETISMSDTFTAQSLDYDVQFVLGPQIPSGTKRVFVVSGSRID